MAKVDVKCPFCEQTHPVKKHEPGHTGQQRWLWYAWEPRLKRIIAHVFGRRSKKTFRQLLGLLSGFNVAFWCADNFSAYDMLQDEKHIRGKFYTQQIERERCLV